MIIGSQCTRWIEAAEAYCGAPVTWMIRDRETDGLNDVLCDQHRTPDSVPIPSGFERAAASVYTRTVPAPPPIPRMPPRRKS